MPMAWNGQAEPKSADNQLRQVRVGFASGKLAALDIVDSFGQRSLIRFSQLQQLSSLLASTFHFTPARWGGCAEAVNALKTIAAEAHAEARRGIKGISERRTPKAVRFVGDAQWE